MTVFSLHVPNILENTVKRKHIRKQSYDVKGYIPIIFFPHWIPPTSIPFKLSFYSAICLKGTL